MNIYDVTKSPCLVYDQGLTLRNEVNHRNLNFLGATQEKKQFVQTKASKVNTPYELWMKAQVPWTSFRQSTEFNSEKLGVEKSVSVSKEAGNIQKEDRDAAVNALLAERTLCTYPLETEDGELSMLTYFTFYEKDRIYCIKEGSEDYEWEMPLEDESQYEKVMSFLNCLKDKENLRFASQQNFWQDYLSGELDVENFQHFLDTRVQKGIPNYANVTKEGGYIDREAIHFSKYVDQPFGELIGTTGKELMEWYRENVISKRKPSLQETDPIEYHYRVFGGRGQKLYYWKGKNYTYEEFYSIDLQEAQKALAKAGNLVGDDWAIQ